MSTSTWRRVLLGLMVLIVLCRGEAAGAFSGTIAVGGGAQIAPDAAGMFSADLSVGMRLPLRYHTAVAYFHPRVGIGVDAGPPGPRARLHVGPGVGFNITYDGVAIGLEPAYVTDFDGHGIRGQVHVGLGADMVQFTVAYDVVFHGGGEPEHSIRAMAGLDIGAMVVGLLRFGARR